MATKKTTKTAKSKKGEYHLNILLNGKSFETSSPSLLEALVEFSNSPEYTDFIKSKLVINYSKGDKKLRKILSIRQGRILLNQAAMGSSKLKFMADKLTNELG